MLVIYYVRKTACTNLSYLEHNLYIYYYSLSLSHTYIYTQDLPESYKKAIVSKELGLKVGSLGVDVYNNFEPLYMIMDKKVEVVKRLRKLTKECKMIILATVNSIAYNI